MRNADTVEQLRAELRQDFEFIRENYRRNREMTRRIEASGTDESFDAFLVELKNRLAE